MYEFAVGPLVWIAFLLFFGGCGWRLFRMFSMAKKDKVVYPYMSLKHGLLSIAHWIVPFGSTNMRMRPLITVVTFAFHVCLLLSPIFLMAHNVLLKRAWGFSVWTLPPVLADVMTVVVILACVFFVARRIRAPEVKYVTSWSDYALVAIVAAPFLTGFLAYHQWLAYKTLVTLHIWAGAIMLVAIPFTRLSHMLFFVFTRAYMGSECGAVRHAKDW
ncbi:MAG: nitrate reductase [Candidatus Lindowbacteria bacterium]|nr:nitrate reductase [Candidatus Lindowbacteria bacterium]